MREFFANEAIKPDTMLVGLYRDADWYVQSSEYPNVGTRGEAPGGDAHDDSDDVGAVTTEPTGATYNRQTVTFGTDWTVSDIGNWKAQCANLEFPVGDSDEIVTSLFFVVTFQSTDANDSQPNEHMFGSIRLKNERDLSIENDTITFSRASFAID